VSRSRFRPFASLETKLPIVIGGLFAVLLLAALAVTHIELRVSAVGAGTERLARVAGQLAGLVDASTSSRARLLESIASDPAVGALLTGASDDEAAAEARLERLRAVSDSGLPIQLRSTQGTIVLETGTHRRTEAPAAEPLVEQAPDAPAWGPIHVERGRAVYWTSAPVNANGHVVGYILQQRRFGSRESGELIEQLVGSQIEIYLVGGPGAPWVGVDGSIARVEPIPALDSVFAVAWGAEEQPYHAVATGLQNGWTLLAAMPLQQMLARTREVTRRLLWFALLLLVSGGVAAWIVSRSVTAPLQRLSMAADAIAAGDYTRRTGIDRSDEIGRLARSFDTMGGQVERSHEQLDQRFREAQTLAGELEAANQRFADALRDVEAARGEAQQASRVKSEFLATISHEIRTPINAMVGYTDLMDMGIGGTLSSQHREYLERIRRSGDHLTALVNDVLDFAKIESGQMRFMRDVRSAPAMMHEARSMLQTAIDAKRIRTRMSCAPDAVFLGDGQRVKQILINLLSNAIKFTPERGSIDLTCDHRTSRSLTAADGVTAHDWTCFTVRDTGIGIPADQLEAIFEPFVQGASGYTRPHGGTGLGLAISRSMARLMGGDISVESRPGAGSSFTLWLPHPATTAAAPA
jgi:signal transduction histidine kinase